MAPRRRSANAAPAPKRLILDPPVEVVLWRPDLVVTSTLASLGPRPETISPGEPALRPRAVMAQVDATRSLLRSIDGARHTIEARAAVADARARQADSERARVSAAIETYQVGVALDQLLVGTLNEVTALMEERGLR